MKRASAEIVSQKDDPRVGAPPKFATGSMEERVTWRLPGDLMADLRRAAKKNRRSLADEARARLCNPAS